MMVEMKTSHLRIFLDSMIASKEKHMNWLISKQVKFEFILYERGQIDAYKSIKTLLNQTEQSEEL